MPFGLIILLLVFTASCGRTEPFRVELALGTVCAVTLYDQGTDSVYDAVFSRIREIENLMSVNIPSSDISLINKNSGTAPVKVHEETFKVIERALYFARQSGGAFDPAIGPIVSLWDIGGDNQRVPSQEEINQTLPLVNWRNIELDAAEKSVYLKEKGMALDFGAIAKGYAADEAAKIAAEAGIKRGLIDLGGNIAALGEKKDRSPWKVGIQAPDVSRGEIMGFLQLTNAASGARAGKISTVVTSGVYERFFKDDGAHYHHIFSPSAGYPVQNGLVSVTITAENSMDADALSTAVFVLGYERGSLLLESFPGTGAVFIFTDKSVIVTGAAEFTLTDNEFYVKK